MGSGVKDVTDASFSTDVLEQGKPVLVDFWAQWCAPCRLLSPVLESIAEDHPAEIVIVKLNVDENPEIAARYSVTALPTIAVFQDGEIAKTITGVKPKTLLLKEIASFLEPVG